MLLTEPEFVSTPFWYAASAPALAVTKYTCGSVWNVQSVSIPPSALGAGPPTLLWNCQCETSADAGVTERPPAAGTPHQLPRSPVVPFRLATNMIEHALFTASYSVVLSAARIGVLAFATAFKFLPATVPVRADKDRFGTPEVWKEDASPFNRFLLMAAPFISHTPVMPGKAPVLTA